MPLSADDTAALEGHWIGLIARGDRGAFERLYRSYQSPLFKYFLHFVHSAAVAEELADDVMVEVWRGAGRYRGRSKPSVWIFGIAYHKAIDALRRRRAPLVELRSIESVLPADPRAAPDASVERDVMRRDLALALATLSPEHRAVVLLTFVHGYAYQEISQIVGCPVNTVKTRMFHAKRHLKQALATRGYLREIS